MNRDLFITILSMDSYNRGYGQSIREDKLRGSRVGQEIGHVAAANCRVAGGFGA